MLRAAPGRAVRASRRPAAHPDSGRRRITHRSCECAEYAAGYRTALPDAVPLTYPFALTFRR